MRNRERDWVAPPCRVLLLADPGRPIRAVSGAISVVAGLLNLSFACVGEQIKVYLRKLDTKAGNRAHLPSWIMPPREPKAAYVAMARARCVIISSSAMII